MVDGSEQEVVEEFGFDVGVQIAALCCSRDQLPDFFQTKCDDAFAKCLGEVVVVSETDDGHAMFERVVRGLRGGEGTVAVGDRVWAETVLNLDRTVGFDRLRTGSTLVNELRRVKEPDELAALGRAIRAVEQAMEDVTPLVLAGATMAGLVEAVEHALTRAGSRCPSFTTHVLTGLEAEDFDSGTRTAHDPIPEGTSVMFDFGGVVDGYCSDFGRTIYCGEPPADYREVYEVMLEAQEAGRAAACLHGSSSFSRPADRRAGT